MLDMLKQTGRYLVICTEWFFWLEGLTCNYFVQ
jgi:hypothetical protein